MDLEADLAGGIRSQRLLQLEHVWPLLLWIDKALIANPRWLVGLAATDLNSTIHPKPPSIFQRLMIKPPNIYADPTKISSCKLI